MEMEMNFETPQNMAKSFLHRREEVLQFDRGVSRKSAMEKLISDRLNTGLDVCSHMTS